jgi:N12 class adenine-specific DNA methylase
VFDDERDDLAGARSTARRLLGTEEAWSAARRTTLNAHYTSAEVVTEVWRAVQRLGLSGGRVLEPGCGSGNFIGFAPEGLDLVGVELDPTTASVARHLYGARALVVNSRFEDYHAPEASFDAAIGNVPFAKVTPHDPRHNRHRLALHNYFIAKSLHLVAPGGTVALLTSRYTLDARNPAGRRVLHGLGDLVGAVRLPARAFAASSGTDVVCDLLVLRRRAHDEPAGPNPMWLRAVPFGDVGPDGEPVWVNEWIVEHPEFVAGTLSVDRGMYREHELTVTSGGELAPRLAAALDLVVSRGLDRGLSHAPVRSEAPAPIQVSEDFVRGRSEGSFVATDGGFGRVRAGDVIAYRPRVDGDASELRRLIRLRDAARQVLDIQLAGGGDAELAAAQTDLHAAYDGYRRVYGLLNRFTLARTGRADPETGDEVMRRVRPRMGGFRDDPDWALVAALEVFDDETQAADKAPIFDARIIDSPPERLGVDTPAEAVAVCLDERGSVTLERVAELLGSTSEDARSALGDLVWDDPETGALVPAAQYLSGNVRAKLVAARDAAASDARFAENVTALEGVLPVQLAPEDITARIGVSWIPPADVETFCSDVLGARIEVEYLPALGRWEVMTPAGRRGVAFSAEWGTPRADAATLLRASLNQQLHTVYDETEDGRRVRHDAETIAAREKQDALCERFASWVWEEPERARRLADRYNELFSSTVIPQYDGTHLSVPGLASTFTPHQHQRDAVARILNDGRALLAHAVGAGKTATMVIAAMEQRRLGLARKPAVVVPNHMLEQFAREWLQLYPTARLLIADREKLSKEHRKEFVARVATGDWDGVIFSQSSFVRLPLGPDLQRAYLSERLERLRDALSQSRGAKGLSVKRLERRVADEEERLRRLQAGHRKDDGVRFEETGLDFLYCDEAHLYKNRRVDSAIDGMAHPGSQRAEDLDAKLWALRQRHGPRVVAFATATPVANSMAELWVMQSYLQPDVLADVALAPFDAWAANFGRTVTSLELSPDGASWRLSTRFARFTNVPELMGLWRQVADVRTTEQLDLPVPALQSGAAETVVVPGSEALAQYVSALAGRAERVRSRAVDPTEDNMLKITGDGRRAALDLRLVGGSPDLDTGKLAVAADRITAIWREHRERSYLDATGRAHQRSGALQLVFCDTSTPAGDGWNAYDALRALLVRRGLPTEQVRFIHEAATDEAKAKLFAACRDGRVAVLLGSTEKMGVGTNVQARAAALHHLDCPWRPADIEQRDGRILRQGNQNPEVQVLRYVTEGSFDTYMWQTLERKATFIEQVTGGDVAGREVDDIADTALTYAEVKALATGNPLIMEKAAVDADVARLTRLQRAHADEQHRLRKALEAAQRQEASLRHKAHRLHEAIARRIDTRGDAFRMTIEGRTFDKRAHAGARLAAAATELLRSTGYGQTRSATLGQLGGFDVEVEVTRVIADEIVLKVPEAYVEARWTVADWAASEPSRIVTGVERRLVRLEEEHEGAVAGADTAAAEAARAGARLGQAFEHGRDLTLAQRRQREITEFLAPEPAPSTESPSAPAVLSPART